MSIEYLEEWFDQYDSIKKNDMEKVKPFSGVDFTGGKTVPTDNKEIWHRDSSKVFTKSDIRSCIIAIRRWFTKRSNDGLPPMIYDHKCSVTCHKNAHGFSPTMVHKNPPIYGCVLSGVLHYCNPSVECAWTITDADTCSRRCIFVMKKCVSEWISPVDANYLNYQKAKDREEAIDCDDNPDFDAWSHIDDKMLGNIDSYNGDDDVDVGGYYNSPYGEYDHSTWGDNDDNLFTSEYESMKDVKPFGHEKRMHSMIFATLEKQKICNTYDPKRSKKRRKEKERVKSHDNSVFDDTRSKMEREKTLIYKIETGIEGDSFYICTPNGDELGYLLGGKNIQKSELFSHEREGASVKQESVPFSTKDSSTVKSDVSIDKKEDESKVNGNKYQGKMLTISEMEKIDKETMNSDEFVQRFTEMSLSLKVPFEKSNGNKKKRGPERGYKRMFSTKVETVRGEDIGIIGFNTKLKSSGIPIFSNSECMNSFIEREKRELGYQDDMKTSESLENYDIHQIIKDKVIEDMNKDIPGYLPKKERRKLKLRRNAGILYPHDEKNTHVASIQLKPKSVIDTRQHSTTLSRSSPTLSCGTPSRHSMTPTRSNIYVTPSPMGSAHNTPYNSPRGTQRTPIIFGTPMRQTSTPLSHSVMSGSTPSRTPSVLCNIVDGRLVGHTAKDISSMRKWPIGKTVSDHVKIADMVGEKANRVIIDLLTDRAPRRTIAKIRSLSMRDDFNAKAKKLFDDHISYKKEDGTRLPIPVNYHTLYSLWKKTCKPVVYKEPPQFNVEDQILLKEKIVKCWMLLSRKEYSSKRNKKKSSVFSFIVGMLYLMGNGGYMTNDGITVIQHDPWLHEHLPSTDDMDILNKRKIGTKSNRGFSCKGNIVSKSISVAALPPESVRVFGQDSNRNYTRRLIGEGTNLIRILLNKYEEMGPGSMENVRDYIYGKGAIDSLIMINPVTEM